MLYIADRNLAFLHIPKNAGQAMRHALESVAQFDHSALARDLGVSEAQIALMMRTGRELPPTTRIQLEHMQLDLIRAEFPAAFDVICQAKSFVLIRPPRDRFISALLQRLGQFKDIKGLRVDDPVVIAEANAVCDWLGGARASSNIEYVHFSQQIHYVDLDGERIIKAIFPVDRIDAAIDWVAAETGLLIAPKQKHVRREPKKWSRAIRPAARFIGRHVIPHPVKLAIYPLWINSRLFQNAAGRYAKISLGDPVENFITRHYAADFALYEEACARVAAQDQRKADESRDPAMQAKS